MALRWCFLDKSLESKREDGIKWPLSSGALDPESLLGLSRSVQSLAVSFMPPEVLANEVSFEG